MDTNRAGTAILKRDVLGRVTRRRAQSEALLDEFERSGMKGRPFARLLGLNYPSFATWIQQHTGRGSACLEQIVPQDYTGLIQIDVCQAYDSFIKQPGRAGNIMLAGCMVHARRKFYEAQEEREDARWGLAQMQALYRIEARLREARVGPQQVRTARQERSVPILEAIHQSLQHSRVHLPRSLTGGAITYNLGQWEKLSVFTRDDRVQIDNNLVENSIRPSAIGKKNWLFMDDAQSGERAAPFYTLKGNCHVGLNAEAYLIELFERLPRATIQTVNELTPHAMAAKRRAAAQAAATEQTAA